MTVPLIGPDGLEYHIASDDPAALKEAQALGYRPVTAEAPVTLGEQATGLATEAKGVAKAGLSGLVKGLTFGVGGTSGDPLVAAEEQRINEESPIAHTLGDVAGSVLSPINAIAAPIEGARAATALGRLGQKVKGGMAVGSLFGAGNVINEAALGDTQLTAEKLVAGAGLGALLGGLGGGMGGAIEEGASKVLPKLGTLLKGGQSTLDDVADHFALKSFRNTKKELQKFSDESLEAAVDVSRKRGHLALTPEGMGKSIADDVAAVGKTKGSFLDAADATGARPDFAAVLKGLDDHAASLSPLQRESLKGPLKEARMALEDIATDPKLGTWRALDEWKRDLQSKAKWLGVSSDDSLLSQGKRALSTFARNELDRQLVPTLGVEGAKFLESKATYAALKTAEKLAHTGSGRGTGFSLTDIGITIAGGTHLGPFGIAGGLGAKFVREHGAAVAAQIADKLAKSPALKSVAASFASSLPATAPQLGKYGPALMLAAERSPELALAQHIVTAQADPEYAAQAQLAGLTPESPAEHAATLGKGAQLAAIQGAVHAHDAAISEGVDHVVTGKSPARASPVLKSQDFGAKRMRQESSEGFRRRVNEIRNLATNPQALIDRTAGNLEGFGDVAPGVAAQMTSMADRAVKYLAAQAEVPAKPGPMAREWIPTATERHAFTLKLRAVQAPMSILEDAARGTLVRSQVDAVRAVYPSLAADIEQKALERMTSGEKMPYRARLMLSLLTGVSADGTTAPRAIAANQRAVMNEQGKPSETMGDPAAQELGTSGRMATKGQKRELATEMG